MDDLILLISELLRLSIFLFSIFDIEAKYAKPHGNKPLQYNHDKNFGGHKQTS